MKELRIPMLDNSTYIVTDDAYIKAIEIRIKENKDWLAGFILEVEKHFNKKTIPTKFGVDYEWYTENVQARNHAELARHVIYPYIRAILMGFMFQKLGGGKVLAMNDDGSVTKYPPEEKEDVGSQDT